MKVLLLTQVLPYPPDSGPKVKTFYVLKYLAKQYEVTLVSFVRGDQTKHIKALETYCHAIYTVPMRRSFVQNLTAFIKSLIGNSPWMMARDDVAEMRKLIDRLAAQEKYDVVHADQLNMAQYALRIPGVKRVLDAHNALWVLYKRLALTFRPGIRRWLLERDWRLLKKYEGQICREFDHVLTVSEEDKASFEEAMGDEKREIHIIPIAVDTDELQPVRRDPDASHIIHVGTMYWPPNIDGMLWFLEKVYPLICKKRPGTVCDIIGARPPKQLLEYGVNHPGVNITGYVMDLKDYYKQAGVMVVPLRAGGGMRVKILNAMAQGIPIVSTSIGAEGISVESEKHILIADEPEQFASQVVRMLDDRELAAFLSANSLNLVRNVYHYTHALQPLDSIYSAHP